jgi:hypothetical protein
MAGRTSVARDGFEQYFTEKLWEMIPAIYREKDAQGAQRGVLRALVAILAEQAAVLRRSQDRLWEDQFIDLCDDWAVPYIGDLVGTRMVSALNKRAQRIDVAKTIYYRRRAGTPALLEELISDISGWEGTVVESFRRLGRTRYRLDSAPAVLAGPHTGTLPGGWADLREPWAAKRVGTAFNEFHHTPDLRHPRGRDGRYGIHRLVFYLYRLRAFRCPPDGPSGEEGKLEGVTPYAEPGTPGAYTFDPSGRDVHLFMPLQRPQDRHSGEDNRVDWSRWRAAHEWELPGPMRCRVLNHAEYRIEQTLIQFLIAQKLVEQAEGAELRRVVGQRFRHEGELRRALKGLPSGEKFLTKTIYGVLLAKGLTKDCGKGTLLPKAVQIETIPGGSIAPEEIVVGDLAKWDATAPDKELVIDPKRGRCLFLGNPPEAVAVGYHYGFSAEIGAGAYDRRSAEERIPTVQLPKGGGKIPSDKLPNEGIAQINDSATYGPVGSKKSVKQLVLQAKNGHRPYVRLEKDWTLSSGGNHDAQLVLDGLWIGASSAPFTIKLDGDYSSVTLLHVTLDPGGKRRADSSSDFLPPVSLVIKGHIERLTIESSIIGPIRTAGELALVEQLCVRDSIIQAATAVQLESTPVHLERVTVLGKLQVRRLWATEVLLTEQSTVTDTQTGCFRFSAAPTNSQLPRPHESHWIDDVKALFVSRRFGDGGYAQLSEAAPSVIQRGAENGSEMGAFSGLLNPIKRDSLRAKIDEFLPFGLLPSFTYET